MKRTLPLLLTFVLLAVSAMAFAGQIPKTHEGRVAFIQYVDENANVKNRGFTAAAQAVYGDGMTSEALFEGLGGQREPSLPGLRTQYYYEGEIPMDDFISALGEMSGDIYSVILQSAIVYEPPTANNPHDMYAVLKEGEAIWRGAAGEEDLLGYWEIPYAEYYVDGVLTGVDGSIFIPVYK